MARALSFVAIVVPMLMALASPAAAQVFTKYLDNQPGVSIVVRGTVPQATALQWLSAVVAAASDADAAVVVTRNNGRGLVRSSRGSAVYPNVPSRVMVRFEDDRTGRSIVVRGSTIQADAVSWLRELTKTRDVDAVVPLVEAHRGEGLVSATLSLDEVGKNGAEVIVAWGDLHRKWQPPRRAVTYQDPPTGRSLSARGDGTQLDAWLKQLVAAKNVGELHKLVEGNSSRGLISARIPSNDITIQAFLDE